MKSLAFFFIDCFFLFMIFHFMSWNLKWFQSNLDFKIIWYLNKDQIPRNWFPSPLEKAPSLHEISKKSVVFFSLRLFPQLWYSPLTFVSCQTSSISKCLMEKLDDNYYDSAHFSVRMNEFCAPAQRYLFTINTYPDNETLSKHTADKLENLFSTNWK